jgi:pSer/pThr/pTyr-binding forkhead associated (FHA) protein
MITCWSCGRDNEAFFKFCLGCGAELDQVPTEVPAEKAAPAPVVARAAAPEPVVAKAAPVPTLVVVRADQSEGARHPLDAGLTPIGRNGSGIQFPDDDFLSGHHADVTVEGTSVFVQPRDPINGAFLRLKEAVALEPGDELRIGQQRLRLELFDERWIANRVGPDGETTLGSPFSGELWGRLAVLVTSDQAGAAHLLHGEAVRVGREEGEVTFGSDPFVSSKHAVFRRLADGRVMVEDQGSRNGTYLRLRAGRSLVPGDTILVGQQLLRLALG